MTVSFFLPMKYNTCLIVWHNKEPVLSLDFHPSGRLATGGADNTIKVTPILYLLKSFKNSRYGNYLRTVLKLNS